jgi:hypothetical protein
MFYRRRVNPIEYMFLLFEYIISRRRCPFLLLHDSQATVCSSFILFYYFIIPTVVASRLPNQPQTMNHGW